MGSKQEQALIISGEALILIQSDENVLTKFMEVADKCCVVIACRVSPK
jgi:hypothetical protein